MDGPRYSNGLMRCLSDTFLIHKVCEYFQPKRALEIGFGGGQTFGTIAEACSNVAMTAVDKNFRCKDTFDDIFSDQSDMEFLEIDSKLVDLPKNYFDFIMVDGDHSYEYAFNDINIALESSTDNGIVCVDDYFMEGVWQAITETLNGQKDWVPFLMGQQSMFFHHRKHQADDFLDRWIGKKGRDIVKLYNLSINIAGIPHLVLNCWLRYENTQDLIAAMKQYDL